MKSEDIFKMHIAIAKSMPEDTMLKELQEALDNFRNRKTEDAHQKLTYAMSTCMIRYATKDMTIEETIKNFDEHMFYKQFVGKSNLN